MNYFFNEDQLEIRELARKIAEEKMLPFRKFNIHHGFYGRRNISLGYS